MNIPLSPEDYQEPACPLCMDTDKSERIPVARIIQKLDEYLNRNDYPSALEHLNYWVKEAVALGDESGLLSLYNERMGLYRKISKKEEAIADAQAALLLLQKLKLEDGKTGGTTLLNAATVYKSFQLAEQALPLYEKALQVFEQVLSPADSLFGGLYNNMGLALVDLRQFDRANAYYAKALQIMAKIENSALEQAITHLNMADAASAQFGLESASDVIEEHLLTAQDLLEDTSLPRNGYYAFVAEKCAPSFRYYGHFFYAKQLEERARSIYERA